MIFVYNVSANFVRDRSSL